MKRYIKYKYKIIEGIISTAGLIIALGFIGRMVSYAGPSKDTQQILRQIQEVQTSIERQISELPLSVNCNK